MFHAVRLTAFNSETTHYGGLEKKMAPAGAGASFGLMKDRVGRMRGAQRPTRYGKVKFAFVAKVRRSSANSLESARRSHDKNKAQLLFGDLNQTP